MSKPVVIVGAVSLAAAATAMWIKGTAQPREALLTGAAMPSIQELHRNADLKGLPVQEVKDPY